MKKVAGNCDKVSMQRDLPIIEDNPEPAEGSYAMVYATLTIISMIPSNYLYHTCPHPSL